MQTLSEVTPTLSRRWWRSSEGKEKKTVRKAPVSRNVEVKHLSILFLMFSSIIEIKGQHKEKWNRWKLDEKREKKIHRKGKRRRAGGRKKLFEIMNKGGGQSVCSACLCACLYVCVGSHY